MRSLSRSVNPDISKVRVTRVCGCRPRYVTLQIVKLTSFCTILTGQTCVVGDEVEPDPVTAALRPL